MGIYLNGGLVMTLTYFLTNSLKKIVSKRLMPLVPLVIAPLLGGVITSLTGGDVREAILLGLTMGTSTMAVHETIDHSIKGN